jgi:xanthosine utilization system XapX-like protein
VTWVWIAIAGAGLVGMLVGVALVAWCLSLQQNALAEENWRMERELRRLRRLLPPISERELQEARIWLAEN